MPESYWDRIKDGKDLQRSMLATLPFEEKLLVLERLRERRTVLRSMWHTAGAAPSSPAANVIVNAACPAESRTVGGMTSVNVLGANATLVSSMVVLTNIPTANQHMLVNG